MSLLPGQLIGPDIQRGSRSRQIMPGPNRAGRIMKSTSTPKYNGSAVHPSFDRISERETSDSEQADYYSPSSCQQLSEPLLVVSMYTRCPVAITNAIICHLEFLH